MRVTLLCLSAALQFGVQVCIITDAGELGIMALSPSAFILVRAAFSPLVPAAPALPTLGCDGLLQEVRRHFVFWPQVGYSLFIVFRALRYR